jgi:hypothetical protein
MKGGDSVDIERIEVRHASEAISARVHRWFETTRRVGIPDGSRSIRLPHPEKRGFDLKIKGAGFIGSQIRFGSFIHTGPVAPVFDFDGRMMEDVAAGHDNAYAGGASFQQAAVEYEITRRLAEAGVAVVPCLGYGRVDTAEHTSWFSLFEWDREWKPVRAGPLVSLQEYLDAHIKMGAFVLDLATRHDLIGYAWYTRAGDGTYRVKDLHPFHRADPVNMSQLSWVMQMIFPLRVLCEACKYFPRAAGIADLPADMATYPWRGVVPEATEDDLKVLHARIVKPYAVKPPEDFTPRALRRALGETRIGAALLDLCPDRYVRF